MLDPVRLEAESLYDDAALRQLLGLSPATLASARRRGGLKFSRKGKRTLYMGAWVLAWLDADASSPSGPDREGGAL